MYLYSLFFPFNFDVSEAQMSETQLSQAQISQAQLSPGASVEAQVPEVQKGRCKCRIIVLVGFQILTIPDGNRRIERQRFIHVYLLLGRARKVAISNWIVELLKLLLIGRS